MATSGLLQNIGLGKVMGKYFDQKKTKTKQNKTDYCTLDLHVGQNCYTLITTNIQLQHSRLIIFKERSGL